MSKWAMVQLGKVASPIERPEIPVPGKPYRQVGVRLWGEGAYERELLDGGETKYKTLSRVETDDIVVNKIWARNGSVAVISENLAGCYVSGEFPTFKPSTDRLAPRWFHWLTKTPSFWEQCDDKSRGTSGKNRIRPERFLEIKIPLPPLAEQRRMVARIETLAAKIEEARGLRSESNGETKSLAHSAADAVFKELSNRYSCKPLSEICQSITDGDHITPPFTEEGVKFIFVGNVSSGQLHFNGCKYVTPSYFASLKPQRVPKRGDILYSAVGATLGVPAVVEEDEAFCFQRHVAILKPKPTMLSPRFGWHMLQSRTVFDRAWASATGSAQPTVPLRAIRELEIPAVPAKEQRPIVAYLDGLQAKVDVVKQLQSETAAELVALLPSILDKAFKGEL